MNIHYIFYQFHLPHLRHLRGWTVCNHIDMMTSSNGNIFRVNGPLSSVNYPRKGQRRGALIFSLICAWINGWVNNERLVIWDAIAVIMTFCNEQPTSHRISRLTITENTQILLASELISWWSILANEFHGLIQLENHCTTNKKYTPNFPLSIHTLRVLIVPSILPTTFWLT